MISKAISVICHIVAGFFVYTIGLLSFVNVSAISPGASRAAIFIIIGIFLIPFVFSILLGMALVRFKNWMRDLGIVLVSGATFTVFVAFTMLCIAMSPETAELYPDNKISAFNGYSTGIGFLMLCYLSGSFLILCHYKNTRRKNYADKTDVNLQGDGNAQHTA